MKLSYFRKSKKSFEETAKNLAKSLNDKKWKIVAQENADPNFEIIFAYKLEWLEQIKQVDSELLTLLPTSFFIVKNNEEIKVGIGEAKILTAATPDQTLINLSQAISNEAKTIINESTGAEELKPTGVKLYSTMTCPYCKMEKAWLDQNNIKHEVVYVDLNQAAGQEMVEKTGQMGVPVTEITFSEGEPEYIVGFDKQRLAEYLSITV